LKRAGSFESRVEYFLQDFLARFGLQSSHDIAMLRTHAYSQTIIVDAMDLFEELEKMALNSLEEPEDKDRNEPSDEDIARWQHLFNYFRNDVSSRIEERRKDYSRNRVSNEHWEIVQSDMEAQGYDREAYEYSLEIGRNKVHK
jgi:hypothetical protein